MGKHRHHRLPLGRSWRYRRSLDREPPAFEVDVVHLVPIDEATGGDIPDFSFVLPAVPKSSRDLYDIGSFIEEVRDRIDTG